MTYQVKYVQTLGDEQKGFEFAFDQYNGGSKLVKVLSLS